MVIQPPAQKPDPQNQPGLNHGQAFFKIRGILIGQMMQPVCRNDRSRRIRQRIQIADHGIGNLPFCNNRIRPTIGSDKNRCE